MNAATPQPLKVEAEVAPPHAARKPFKAPFDRRTTLAVGVAVIVAAAGAIVIAMPKSVESTDAAYVQADSSVVAPKVRGLVSEILVEHNQPVRKGQPLVRIDPEEFDAKAASAAADLANADANVAAAKAAIVSLTAEQGLADANVRASRTAIASADAQNGRAQADAKRYDDLVAYGAVPAKDADQYKAQAVSAQSDADKSRALLDVSREQAAVVGAKRATLQANLGQAVAAEGRAKAALDLAKQDQGHTVVYAPIDGVVGDRQANPGDYVQPGTRLLTVSPLSNALYVTANFKETQIGRMRPGQTVKVKIDALPGVTLKGEVESLAPGTGSEFSLLPFEPGTGNFTKIVQRVPVRIHLDSGQPGLDRLRPGLSSVVKVNLKS